MNDPVLPPQTLPVHPRLVRLLLSEAASKALDSAAEGSPCFMCAMPARSPEHAGRWILYCLPLDHPTAEDAQRVALGTHRAIRRKK